MIEGENYELICRNESGYRRGDELHLVDSGRHGPGLTNAAAGQNRGPFVGQIIRPNSYFLIHPVLPRIANHRLDCLDQGTLQ
jgi:hypothetical protein